jgi:predicted nucleic acid-binding protein
VAELLVGVELATDPIAERRRVDEALEDITILEFEESAALRYAKFTAHLRRIGRLGGAMDVFVASVAGGSGMALLTRNPRHFQDIPGLVIESY